MLGFFTGELSADAILDFLAHLPRTSEYHAALADDEELAARLADEPPQPVGSPPLTEFSPEVQVLAEVRDLLAAQLAVLVKVNGGKPAKVKPYPRPVTALQRMRLRARFSRHRDLVKRVLPGRT